MAESKALKRLESEVTCPLCLEILTEPKRLPCDHVYCAQCLRGLALRSTTGSISCPECRQDTPVPRNFDVSRFVTPHQVNRLIEMYQQNLRLAETDGPTPQPATCTAHKSQPLALYCETCESLVCRDCVILSCAKKNHQHGYIEDMVKKYQNGLQQQLKPVRALCQQMQKALDNISTSKRELEKAKTAKLQQVHSTFKALAEILAEEEQYFAKSIEKSFEKQEKINVAKKEEISTILTRLESTIQSTEIKKTPTAFLASVTSREREIGNAMKITRNISLHPVEIPQPELELLSQVKFREYCYASNLLYTVGDPHGETCANIHNLHIPVGKPSMLTFCIDIRGLKETIFKKHTITAQLLRLTDNAFVTVTVKKVTPEQYSLSFVPSKRGRHELQIMCNNTHICGSPLPVFVTIPPHQLKAISSKSHSAAAIKCHDGKIYVSDNKNSIIVLNPVTHSIVRRIYLPGINEILITKNFIYATGKKIGQVLKMDRNGDIVKTSGVKGSGLGQFNFPNGIRMSKDKEIYVCDSDNHRIQVLDEDLNVIRVIGREGQMNGCFRDPSDLDFDEEGNIYVVEMANHRIQVLTKEGQHIRNIGSPGLALGQLNRPVSPAIFRNMLYVTELGNKRISVFQLNGEFVTAFGHNLTRPECIAIDKDGYIHVTCNREKVMTF